MCDSTLKVGQLLDQLKCSILRRAILIGEIITHKITKISFRYCDFQGWWRASDDKTCHETYK